MAKSRAPLSFFLLCLAASLSIGCGSSSNRQLQSIAIQATVNGEDIQFVATGTFSAPPTTVSPLAVSWSYAPPPPDYTLTAQPFLYSCAHPQTAGPIVAMAPSDPNAPNTGSMFTTNMIINSGPIPCPSGEQ